MKNQPFLQKTRPGLLAALLLALAATAGAATTPLNGKLILRPVTPTDKSLYGLPSTTDVSGGLSVTPVGQPVYLEAEINLAVPASDIAAYYLRDSAKLYLYLDEPGTPTQFADASPLADHASCVACPTPDEASGNGAQIFSGTQYLRVPVRDTDPLRMTSSLTISAWVRPVSGGGSGQVLLDKEGEYELAILDGTLQWSVSSNDPGPWAWVNTGVALPVGSWSHVALVVNGSAGSASTYVNGALVHQRSFTGPIGDDSPGQQAPAPATYRRVRSRQIGNRAADYGVRKRVDCVDMRAGKSNLWPEDRGAGTRKKANQEFATASFGEDSGPHVLAVSSQLSAFSRFGGELFSTSSALLSPAADLHLFRSRWCR